MHHQIRQILLIVIFVSIRLIQTYAQFEQKTNLPTMYINTFDGEDPWSKEIYQSAQLVVKSTIPGEEINVETEIRGRGNATWGRSKKPYRIKLNKSARLMNNSAKAKKWVLLANDMDKTLIRNAVAFEISRFTGMTFTPSTRFVDLVLNNRYVGNYMLTDQIDVREHRVPVEEQDVDVTNEPELTGGYLLEVDGWAPSKNKIWFRSTKSVPISIKYPNYKDINTDQYNYIHNFVNLFESKLFAKNFTDSIEGYRSYVDESSLVNWYIICEFSGNSDSFWSTFFYKFRNQDRLYFGPMWDFDIAFNNDGRLGDATRKLMRDHAHNPKTWISQLWKDDWFKRAVNNRWIELINEGILEHIVNYIDELSSEISSSQYLNNNVWNRVSNYSQEVEKLKTYMTARAEFLTESFASDAPPEPSAPFVPSDNHAYMIMNVKTNNVINVENDLYTPNSPLNLVAPLDESHDSYLSQRWKFKLIEDNYYQIINIRTGLAIAGNGQDNNLIQMLPNQTDYSQWWEIIPVLTDHKYGIVSIKSGLSMNNKGGNYSVGTPVIEYNNRIEESENQQWYIKQMEELLINNEKVLFNNADLKVKSFYSNGILNLKFENYHAHPLCSIKIYNIQGNCMFTNSLVLSDSQVSIPLMISHFPKGVYIIEVQFESSQRFVTRNKIILQ